MLAFLLILNQNNSKVFTVSILIKNIKELVQVRENNISIVKGKDMKTLPVIKNAYLYIENDTIVDFGPMSHFNNIQADKVIDATGKAVLPAWCDSHTHIVYAGNRIQEFVDRINGLSYEDIANRGGGILNSAEKLQNSSEDELYEQALKRLNAIIKMGTAAVEIKSGYGLTTDAELKMLRVIKRLKKQSLAKIVPTFLGAHAIPKNYKNKTSEYVDLIINDMLPKVVQEQLSQYVDVFCEKKSCYKIRNDPKSPC